MARLAARGRKDEHHEAKGYDDFADAEHVPQREPRRSRCPLTARAACPGGAGSLRKHARCYFNHPDGIAAVRAGIYAM